MMNKKILLMLSLAVFMTAIILTTPVKAGEVTIAYDVSGGSVNIDATISAGWATSGYETAIKGIDHLYVEADWSGGYLHYTTHDAHDGETAWFSFERWVVIENGEIEAFTERDNTWWSVDTDYFAGLESSGDGLLCQNYYNQYDTATMNTYMLAGSDYSMGAGESGTVFGEFSFDMGGEGSGEAELYLSLTDWSGYYYRNMFGDFYFDGDCDAGFNIETGNELDMSGFINVDGALLLGFDYDETGGSNVSIDGEGDTVEFAGEVTDAN